MRGVTLCALVVLLSVVPAFAHGPNQPAHQLYRIGDLKLESGEVIKDFAISYVTHGTLNAKKYTLMADKPFVDPNTQIRDHLERVVTIKGDLYEAPGGQKVLAIKEVQTARAGAANPC